MAAMAFDVGPEQPEHRYWKRVITPARGWCEACYPLGQKRLQWCSLERRQVTIGAQLGAQMGPRTTDSEVGRTPGDRLAAPSCRVAVPRSARRPDGWGTVAVDFDGGGCALDQLRTGSKTSWTSSHSSRPSIIGCWAGEAGLGSNVRSSPLRDRGRSRLHGAHGGQSRPSASSVLAVHNRRSGGAL